LGLVSFAIPSNLVCGVAAYGVWLMLALKVLAEAHLVEMVGTILGKLGGVPLVHGEIP